MFKPRQLHRRETGKARLYSALRALYLDGVRVCTGRRRQEAIKPTAPPPPRRQTRPTNPLRLVDDVRQSSSDPYNTSRR